MKKNIWEIFIDFMEDYNNCNLSKKFKQLPEEVQKDKNLIKAMRHYDYTVNVKWTLAHYNAANSYLGGGDKDLKSTGGSSWQKYMHPKYQRRIFFPYLWSEEELKKLGNFLIFNKKLYWIKLPHHNFRFLSANYHTFLLRLTP